MANYLSAKEVIRIHYKAIKLFGGAHGVHDVGLLESAVARPKAGFGDYEAYPDLFMKAAVLLHSLVKNHPFIDGNKRTALVGTGLFLVRNEYHLVAEKDELVVFVLDVAQSRRSESEIAVWLRQHSQGQ